jgi:cytochrome c biogenesis protein CcdA/thiol-disulfide isomerase/thioredoxin
MLLLIGFAFIAGIVTILSPCILPILPVVLSSSVVDGKRRPVGIICGFIFSFTFFTLFLSSLVKFFGLSAEVLRALSVVIIIIFAISLLLPIFQIYVEKLFTTLSKFSPARSNKSGFLGGVLVGLSLGLLWTPCVGPILASVITLAATSSVTLETFLITLAYSVGTSIPMFAIMYGGSVLIRKIPGIFSHLASIQKAFAVFMLLTAFAIANNYDRKFQAWILSVYPEYGVGLTTFENNDKVQNELDRIQSKTERDTYLESINSQLLNSTFPQAPELIPGGEWFNSESLKISELKGKVVLVDFWTYTCINCIRTLPYIEKWHEKYSDKGLVIIGVHTPEFEFEKNPVEVQKAINDFKLKYPVVQDNNYETWRAYHNRAWPAKYLIDKDGRVREFHEGEGGYNETEESIVKLLKETGSQIDEKNVSNQSYSIFSATPELYLGSDRIEYNVSPEEIENGKSKLYSIPSSVPSNRFAYGGNWTVMEEFAAPSKGAVLDLHYESKEVFLVMRPKNGVGGKVKVYLDGALVGADNAGSDVKDGVVTIDSERLYRLIKLESPGSHLLKLEFENDLIELYAFTFG